MDADQPLHGINLLPVLENAEMPTRAFAVYGQFGKSVSITDGTWVLHQSPVADNQPLYWYDYCLSKFLRYDLGPYVHGRRPVIDCASWPEPTWLSYKPEDMNELNNLAVAEPEQLRRMQRALKDTILRLHAPVEQLDRLGIRSV
jgi:hypothetical protein